MVNYIPGPDGPSHYHTRPPFKLESCEVPSIQEPLYRRASPFVPLSRRRSNSNYSGSSTRSDAKPAMVVDTLDDASLARTKIPIHQPEPASIMQGNILIRQPEPVGHNADEIEIGGSRVQQVKKTIGETTKKLATKFRERGYSDS